MTVPYRLDPQPLIISADCPLGDALGQMLQAHKDYVVVERDPGDRQILCCQQLLTLLYTAEKQDSLRQILPTTSPAPYVPLWSRDQQEWLGVVIPLPNWPTELWDTSIQAQGLLDLDLHLCQGNATLHHWQEHLDPIDWSALIQAQPQWVNSGSLAAFSFECTLPSPQQPRHVLAILTLLRDPVPWGYHVQLVDRTERHEVEQMNAAVIAAIPDLMVKINREGQRKFFIPGKDIRLIQPEISMRQDTNIYQVLPLDLAQQRMYYVHKALDTQTPQVYEYTITVDGETLYEEARITPCGPDDVLLLVRNITNRKQAQIDLHRQYERAQVINAITNNIRQSLDLETILTTTVQEIHRLLATDRVLIYQFEPDMVGTITAEAISDPSYSLLGHTIKDNCFINHWHHAYRAGRVSSIRDIEKSHIQPCHRQMLASLHVRANLIVPVVLERSQLWGLLVAHHCAGPYEWDPWMVELLSDLANQLAIAIQQGQLHHRLELTNSALQYQVNVRNAELQNLLDYEKLLRSITDIVRSSLSEELVLQATVEAMQQGLDLEQCIICFLKPDYESYVFSYVAGRTELQGQVFPMDLSTHRDIFKGKTIYFSTDDPSLGRTTQIDAPIRGEQSLLGFIKLVRSSGAEFNPAEIRLAEQVANQCAISIRQARLYQTSLEQVHKLEEINHLKDEFVHMVSHELRTPLTNMNMALKMIELGEASDRQKRYFGILRSEWNRELNLVNELLELQALESGTRGLALHPVVLDEWLPQVIIPFQMRAQEHHQHFHFHMEKGVSIFLTDAVLLERILMEILNNACKYTPADENIWLRVEDSDCYLRIWVENTGVDIPADKLSRLFDKFFRIPSLDHWNQGGTGLGLALVKKAVELLEGHISVDSKAGHTRFFVELPYLNATEYAHGV
ncbi:MAG: hypothetical protein OHK0012_17240 [Synechococcales cyanobacterium]